MTKPMHLNDYNRGGGDYFTLCGEKQSHAGNIVHTGQSNGFASWHTTQEPLAPLCSDCRERLERVVDLDAEPEEPKIEVTVRLPLSSANEFRSDLFIYQAEEIDPR